MVVATMASSFFPSTNILSATHSRKNPTLTSYSSSSSCSIRASSTRFLSPYVADSLKPSYFSSSRAKRSVVTMVIPFKPEPPFEDDAPPDLASYLFHHRIVYLGMPLFPAVVELLMEEFIWLNYSDPRKTVYLYINSTGASKPQGDEKFGNEAGAFALYDLMSFIKPPIHTLCVGDAWGEAALLLAAGLEGCRASLSSGTIMIRQPIGRVQGEATDIDLTRKAMKHVHTQMVKLYAKHTGKTTEQIEEDIRHPKYFSPSEAVEYGIIDKVLYSSRGKEDKGVIADLKRSPHL